MPLRNGTPPLGSAGKNFIALAPRSASRIASDTVPAPARYGTPEVSRSSSSRSVVPGVTR
jgi:hypothetical protein